MSGDALRWFSKKYCFLDNNIVYFPKWLEEKMLSIEWEKLKKNKKNGRH